MIKKIHRFWGGPPMPDEYKFYGEEWKRLNPDWQVIDWTQDLVESSGMIINREVYDDLAVNPEGTRIHEAALATQRADVIAYELVLRYGGLYVNTDIQPVRPLANMFNDYPHLCGMAMATHENDEHWVNNGVMWAPWSGNFFWTAVVSRLPDRYRRFRGRDMNEVTGPHLLTEVYQDLKTELVVLPKNYFSPIYLTEIAFGSSAEFEFDQLPPETIGVHHWGHRKNMRPHRTYELV